MLALHAAALCTKAEHGGWWWVNEKVRRFELPGAAEGCLCLAEDSRFREAEKHKSANPGAGFMLCESGDVSPVSPLL